MVADGLDIVAVGCQHEGGVVVGAVLGPDPRGAVVGATGGQRRAMEGFNLLPGFSGERQMERRDGGLRGCAPDAQRCDALGMAKLDAQRTFRDAGYPERRERLQEEGLGWGLVADA